MNNHNNKKSTKKEESDFLRFSKKDISLIPNIAKNCINFKNKEINIHLPPYYFCTLCKEKFCYNCSTIHLLKNKNDNKHTLECMITQEYINQKKNQIIGKSLFLQNNFISNYKKQMNFLENERIILSELKKDINEKLKELDDFFEKQIVFLKSMNVNFDTILNHNYNNKKNYDKNSNVDFVQSLSNLNNLIKDKDLIKKIFYTSLDIYSHFDDKINKKKNKLINGIAFYVENYMRQFYKKEEKKNIFNDYKEIENRSDKYLNFKRKRIDNEESINELSYNEAKEAIKFLFPSFNNNLDEISDELQNE